MVTHNILKFQNHNLKIERDIASEVKTHAHAYKFLTISAPLLLYDVQNFRIDASNGHTQHIKISEP